MSTTILMTEEASLKVDVRTAIMAARNYLMWLGDMIDNEIQDLRLEEVELSEDKNFWFVTLGFNRPIDSTKDPLGFSTITRYEREYKIFKIDVKTGEVYSMKIREV